MTRGLLIFGRSNFGSFKAGPKRYMHYAELTRGRVERGTKSKWHQSVQCLMLLYLLMMISLLVEMIHPAEIQLKS